MGQAGTPRPTDAGHTMARPVCEEVPVSDPVGEYRDHAELGLRLRRQLAELADSIADTEEQVASTYEKIARHRSPEHARRLRAKAEEARRFAASERRLSARYRHGDEDGSPYPA